MIVVTTLRDTSKDTFYSFNGDSGRYDDFTYETTDGKVHFVMRRAPGGTIVADLSSDHLKLETDCYIVKHEPNISASTPAKIYKNKVLQQTLTGAPTTWNLGRRGFALGAQYAGNFFAKVRIHYVSWFDDQQAITDDEQAFVDYASERAWPPLAE